ncbi:MAG TPA: DNA polymerase ligase N-terminal domain-containing protein [Terracidiphilus sp.]|nr:DNA polymerase ligase N-terminal domain-containing protein [Terracidiphilus sp.]
MASVAPYLAFSRRPLFVKYHDAGGYLHYDLRLEYQGVLLSWALPDGLSYYPNDRYEAIEVDDHRKEYGAFEGVRERDTVMLWDRGMWESEQVDIGACLRKGVLRFSLYGEKLKGRWTLTRSLRQKSNGRVIWAICKDADAFARSQNAISIMDEAPYSVISGKTMEEIRQSWGTGRKGPHSELTLFEM